MFAKKKKELRRVSSLNSVFYLTWHCVQENTVWIAVILQLQILCFTCLQCAFMHMSFVFGCTLKNELSFSTVLSISLSLLAKSLRSFKYLFSKIKSLPLLCILCLTYVKVDTPTALLPNSWVGFVLKRKSLCASLCQKCTQYLISISEIWSTVVLL